MWILVRTDVAHEILYHNGVVFDTSGVNSGTLANRLLHLMCANNGGVLEKFSTRQYALAFIGGVMDQTKVTAFQTIWVDGYLNSIGAKV
jgi:hypothetical protein